MTREEKEMKVTWYKYIFEDGFISISGKMSSDEINVLIRKHGRVKQRVAVL